MYTYCTNALLIFISSNASHSSFTDLHGLVAICYAAFLYCAAKGANRIRAALCSIVSDSDTKALWVGVGQVLRNPLLRTWLPGKYLEVTFQQGMICS
jgi:hypothetical protein